MDFFGVCVLYSVPDVIFPPQLHLNSYDIARYNASDLYSGWKSMDNYDTCASVFVVLFNGFMSFTSYFDVMYKY